jgi:hypothetical protein
MSKANSRRKKSSDPGFIGDEHSSGMFTEDIESADGTDREESEQEIEVPIATQRHRVVTEFVKHVPISSTPTESAAPQPALVSQSPEPVDEVQEFLDAVSKSSARWEMVVYRLPRYHIDNRIDPMSRKRVGAFPFTWDYESEIQKRWARPNENNDFLVVMRKDGQFVRNGTLPVFSCESLPIEDRIPSGADIAPQQPQQIVVPYPAMPDQTAAQAPDLMQQFEGFLKLQNMMMKGLRNDPHPQQQPPAISAAPVDPEIAFLQVLSQDDTIVDKVRKGLIGKLLGENAATETDPWAEVAKEAIKSGQAVEIVKAGIEALFSGFSNWLPKPVGQNGTPQMVPSPPSPSHSVGAPGAVQVHTHEMQAGLAEGEPQSEQGAQPYDEEIQMVNPAQMRQQLLGFILEQCKQQTEPIVVRANLIRANDGDPSGTVAGYLDLFMSLPTDQIFDFLKKAVPDAEAVIALPHTKDWVEELKELLTAQYAGGALESD